MEFNVDTRDLTQAEADRYYCEGVGVFNRAVDDLGLIERLGLKPEQVYAKQYKDVA